MSILITSGGSIQFSYNASTADANLSWDPFGYMLNSSQVVLANTAQNKSGTVNVTVPVNTDFGFYVHTKDGNHGPSTTIVNNFVFTPSPTITNFSIPTKTSGNTITIVGAGSSTITATQAATPDYTSRTITTTFLVNPATPTITNFSIPTKTFGNIPFTITPPTSNSSGSFSYTSSDTLVATISGNTITIVGAGSSTITVTQAATTNYTLETATTTFLVNQATPSITNFSIPAQPYSTPSFNITDPSSNSSGAFSYTSSNTLVVTIVGSTITIVGAGSSIITATQAATANYTSGTITTVFQVNLLPLQIVMVHLVMQAQILQ